MARFLLRSDYPKLSILSKRFLSSSTEEQMQKIMLSDDQSMFIAWHPPKDFPYECTKPLVSSVEDFDTSVLKTKLTPQLMEIFNKKTPEQARLELMNLTHTTKHRWFPRARDKKIRKLEMDREYL